MNNRGITFLYTLMLGITIIVLGIALAYPIKVVMDEKMTELTCTSPSDDWTQALCWGLDITKPALTGLIIFIGIAVLTAKSIIGG